MKQRPIQRFFGVSAVLGLALAAVVSMGALSPAQAHFQMAYTPDAVAEPGQTLDLKLVFTHPFAAGHTMDMDTPQAFFVEHKGRRTDLSDRMETITWKSLTNKGIAYEAVYQVRSMGDYVFCLEPAPYYEENEDCYIQQFTKSYVNVAGMPTDWDREIGMPAEIVPLDKPYAIWAGSTFRGVVKGDGEPVPYAEIEVEYLNHEPLMDEDGFAEAAMVEPPFPAMETLTIKADADGEFVFGIPRTGWWGFCALGVGPEDAYRGKELSQDAVIWVKAYDMD